MKHICDEKGCRLVSDEEYDKIMKKSDKNQKKIQKK